MLTIWGGLKSNNVQKVVWTAGELALDYRLIPAGMEHGLNDTAGFLAMNPNGRVPVIDDGGFVLWESNTIVRYLGATYGAPHFCPTDTRQRALAERWIDWSILHFYPAMGPAFRHLVRTPPDQRDAGVIAQSMAQAEAHAEILDRHLADHDFANGATFSMADVCLGVIAHRWMGLPADRVPRPNLERWFRAVSTRDAAKKVLSLPLR
jgi:glutathione S-transferase